MSSMAIASAARKRADIPFWISSSTSLRTLRGIRRTPLGFHSLVA